MINVSFHELAVKEFIEARDFYDSLAFGLGEKFVLDLEYAVNRLSENPLMFPIKFVNYRAALLRKFPYSIIFKAVSREEIIILAIAHQKRKPNYWATRE
jgi:plasmid stabilization system protein ParE